MKCPLCTVDLVMADRQGIEIDYCPKCRGIWLDRGEIDKIVERSAALEAQAVPAAAQAAAQPAGFAAPAPQPGYAPPPPRAGWVPPAQAGWAPPQPQHRDWRRDDDDDDDDRRRGYHGKRKRKGFLSDLLDFD